MRRSKWVGIVVVVMLWITGIAIFWITKEVLASFFIALILAYILESLVGWLQKKGSTRLLAIIYIYLILGAGVFVACAWGLPKLLQQVYTLLEFIPQYMDQLQHFLQEVEQQYAKVGLPHNIQNAIAQSLFQIEEKILAVIMDTMNGIISLMGHIVEILLIPILTFYFLKDKQYLQQQGCKIIPVKLRGEVELLGIQINHVLHGFLLGSLMVSSIVAVLSTIGFLIIDLEFALVFGLIAGIFNLIPYFGPIIGMLPAVVFATFQSPKMAILVVIVVLVVQQIESNFITPKVIGNKVGVHPVIIIFVLLAAGQLFGLWGLLLAVPMTGIVKILMLYFINKVIYWNGTSW